MRLAVIPARGGSKRIPRKNIREFCGKPILAWSIEAARASGCFDGIIVSTDDPEIAHIALKFGAEVPFIRPAELSDDMASTAPVVRHAIESMRAGGTAPDYVCCIYATAPLLAAEDLRLGLDLLENTGSAYAFSVTSYPFPIQRAVRIQPNGRVAMFCPEHARTRSQDLEPAYHDAGQFYWGNAQAWLGEEPIFGSNSVPVLIPRHRVQDIDTDEDWLRAEWLFRSLQPEEKAVQP